MLMYVYLVLQHAILTKLILSDDKLHVLTSMKHAKNIVYGFQNRH
jgi:hypothetical protein